MWSAFLTFEVFLHPYLIESRTKAVVDQESADGQFSGSNDVFYHLAAHQCIPLAVWLRDIYKRVTPRSWARGHHTYRILTLSGYYLYSLAAKSSRPSLLSVSLVGRPSGASPLAG